MQRTPRPSSVAGVARALVVAMGPTDAADILVAQFDWDRALHALASLEGSEPRMALYQVLRHLPVTEAQR